VNLTAYSVAVLFFTTIPDSVDTRIDAQLCGSNSLALSASFVAKISPAKVHSLLDEKRAPFSFQDLSTAARTLRLSTALVHWNNKSEARFDCPAILHVRGSVSSPTCDHFIVCFGQQGEHLCVADYPNSPKLVSREWVFRFWDGDALYIDDSSGSRIATVSPEWSSRGAIWLLAGVVGACLILIVSRWFKHSRWAAQSGERNVCSFGGLRKFTVARTTAGLAGLTAIFVIIALGTIKFVLSPNSHDSSAGLVAAEPLIAADSTAIATVERAKVKFRIQNVSTQTIAITDVSTTCSCLAPAGMAGTKVRAGEELPLQVQVSVPELGATTQQILVFHDGPGSPLALGVTAQGRRKLPVVERVENGFPLFDDLAALQTSQTMQVHTFEEIGAEPWLGELSAVHPAIKITRGEIKDEEVEQAGFVRRTYEFTVGWSSIPTEGEVRSPVYVKTPIDPAPGVFIGSVAARVHRPRFAPTAVVLQRGGVENDLVLFNDPPDENGSWQIAKEPPLPAWLTAEWTMAEGRPQLRLSLTDALASEQTEHFELVLTSGDNQSAVLRVSAQPAR
jgi:hypothetical protein